MLKRLLITLTLAAALSLPGWCDLKDDLVQLADSVFSGNGSADQVEWENFTFQIMPDLEPIDIAALFRPGSTASNEQREAAKAVFLKSQGLAFIERQGKTMTQFLLSKGFTMALREHDYNPVLYFVKANEPSRRFDFVRRDGKLRLAKVTLQQPSQND